MTPTVRDIAETLFILPPDAKLLPVSELSARLRARIGPVDHGQSVITRPGHRVTTRLVPEALAALVGEFRQPSLLTDAVLRFSRVHGQDPIAILDLAFDALATLVESRILVPADSAEAHAPEPGFGAGQAVAGFEIEGLVRSLEDTEVYRARDPEGVPAALKIARDDNPLVADMLGNEARILALLGGVDSPRLLAHGVELRRAYVAMEWCDGVQIAVAAQQARASRDRRRLHRLVAALLEAYGRLHARGILHGDIHPGNCLVRDDGRVVLLDFGRARRAGGEARPDPARAGIPQFHDPEMARALLQGHISPATCAASEQYSLAVLAYLLLTGLHPIETTAVQDQLLRHIVERPPLPFAARGVAAWPRVEAVLRRGLAKHPGDRFPDVASLARALRSAGRPAGKPRTWSGQAQVTLDAAIIEARNPASSAGHQLRRSWFSLRAALALGDAELLASADLLAGEPAPGWVPRSVAACIARARSDARGEQRVMEGFLAAAGSLSDTADILDALQAAAVCLDGATGRGLDVAQLASWASHSLERLAAVPGPDASEPVVRLAFAALALARTGTVALPRWLPSRLEALSVARKGGVWLWALAHDVLAEDRFRAAALEAGRPREALARGLCFLRLHQMTGEPRFAAAACRLVETDCSMSDADRALLMIETIAPELAVLPPYLGALASSPATRRPQDGGS